MPLEAVRSPYAACKTIEAKTTESREGVRRSERKGTERENGRGDIRENTFLET